MKKIVLMLAVVAMAVFYACSNEPDSSELNNSQGKVSKNESLHSRGRGTTKLDSLYEIMITSSRYIDLESARATFIEKLKYKGAIADIDTNEKLLNWVSTNIRVTDFHSYTEAKNELKIITDRSKEVILENLNFYLTLQGDPNPYVSYYDLVNPENANSSTNPCLVACQDSFVSSASSIAQEYSDRVVLAMARCNFFTDSSIDTMNDQLTAAEIGFDIAMDGAKNTLKLCISGCLG